MKYGMVDFAGTLVTFTDSGWESDNETITQIFNDFSAIPRGGYDPDPGTAEVRAAAQEFGIPIVYIEDPRPIPLPEGAIP